MKPIATQVEVFIPRQPQTVFEYFADLRHEPAYNARVHDVRKTTDGPLACGTRFEGHHDGIGTVSWTLVEFDAPRPLLRFEARRSFRRLAAALMSEPR